MRNTGDHLRLGLRVLLKNALDHRRARVPRTDGVDRVRAKSGGPNRTRPPAKSRLPRARTR
jgi:hypothetical protein